MICSIVTIPYKYNYCIPFKGLSYMYVTINYNMYTICIRNMARSKSIPLLCTHVGSYKFRKVHPPSQQRTDNFLEGCFDWTLISKYHNYESSLVILKCVSHGYQLRSHLDNQRGFGANFYIHPTL